jgi:hypothetical protein
MSFDRAITTGIFGGSPKPAERCPATGRLFENGSGALPRDEQTAMFLREQAAEIDRPKEGESCPQTGRPYDCSIGARPKSEQSAVFLQQLSPADQARRRADFEALTSATRFPAATTETLPLP